MIPFLFYLLKAILCSGTLLGYYWLALRNKLFHQWNRFYLLISVLLSLLVPLITINLSVDDTSDNSDIARLLTAVAVNEEVIIEGSKTTSLALSAEQIGLLVYGLISTTLFLIILLAARRIAKIIYSHPIKQIEKVYFLNTEAKGTPYAFLNYIVWNRQINIHSKTGQKIFRHELAHVQEKHTLDKVFLLLVLIPFWINPFFWLIRKELHAVHEFIADKKAMDDYDSGELAQMILNTAFPQQSLLFTNHFFHSIIKRRIHMFNQLQNPKISYVSRILALPLLALVVAAFTLKPNQNIPALEKPITVVIDAGHGGKDAGAITNDVTEKDLALAIAQQVKQQNNNTKIKIVLTRDGDQYPDLKDRVQMAIENKADLFLSIHINSVADNANEQQKASSGIEVVIPSKNPSYQGQSELLASALVQRLSSVYTTAPQLMKRKTGLWVLDHNVCPAVLIDCGYLSNPKDVAFLQLQQNQQAIAEKVLKAIEQYAVSKERKVTSPLLSEKKIAAPDTVPGKLGKVLKVDFLKDGKATILFENGFQITDWNDAVEKNYISREKSDQLINNIKTKNHPYVVVDGEVKDYTESNVTFYYNTGNSSKDYIISKLSAKEALAKYGEKGRYGAIEVTSKKKSHENNIVFTKAEVEPKFPGTTDDWRKFLQQHLNAAVPVDSGAAAGQYTVIVQFIVDKDGSISDLKALTKHGYGMEQEVLRVMKLSPKWEPPVQNGRKVKAYKKQPVTFVISDETNEPDTAPQKATTKQPSKKNRNTDSENL